MTEHSPRLKAGDSKSPASLRDLNSKLMDNVGVRLEAFLGSARMTAGELAALASDAVIPLDAPLSQSVEIRLNGVAIAKGELVAIGDNFGVRLTEISK